MKIKTIKEIIADEKNSASALLELYHKSQRRSAYHIQGLSDLEKKIYRSLSQKLNLKQNVLQTENEILNALQDYGQPQELPLKNIVLKFQDKAQADLSEDEKKMTEWVAELKLLKGIPLSYMVPLHHLLPSESIRFFAVDQQWVNDLIRGALSIGNNQSGADVWHDRDRIKILNKKSDLHLHDVQTKSLPAHLLGHFSAWTRHKLLLRKLRSLKNRAPKSISGFIMRSDFVIKYPGVRIEANDNQGETCPCLSSDVISQGIKICLFEGRIDKLTFYENSDSLLYKMDPAWTGFLKDGRLNITELAKHLNAGDSANLAREFLCSPETFTFELHLK